VEASFGPLEWGRVESQHDRILIVLTGPSLRHFELDSLLKPKYAGLHIIAVNRAIDWMKRVDSFFTLDPNDLFYDMLVNRMSKNVTYYAAVPDDYGSRNARWNSHRVTPVVGPVYLRRLVGSGYMKSRQLLSDDKRAIHTGNSGWGGFGLAYHMEPKKIGILGLDATRDAYAYGAGRPRTSLEHLPKLFESAIPQLLRKNIQVMNGSPRSRVSCFRKATPSEVVEWLVE